MLGSSRRLFKYLNSTGSLFLSVFVVFLVPMIETHTIKALEPRFLAYLAQCIPFITIISSGTRIYSQLDYADCLVADPVLQTKILWRSAVVALTLFLVCSALFLMLVNWSSSYREWPLLLLMLLAASAVQFPRYIVQSIATSKSGLQSLAASMIMVFLTVLFCILTWWTAPSPRAGISWVMAGSFVSSISAVGLSLHLLKPLVGSTRSISSRALHFNVATLRTAALSVLEVVSYNLMAFGFYREIASQSTEQASIFSYVSVMSLVVVSWRLTFAIQFQSELKRSIASSPILLNKIYKCFLLRSIVHVVISLIAVSAFVCAVWGVEKAVLSIAFYSAQLLIGATNQLSLAGLRSLKAMERMTPISMFTNGLATLAYELFGSAIGIIGIAAIALLEEAARSTISFLLYFREVSLHGDWHLEGTNED